MSGTLAAAPSEEPSATASPDHLPGRVAMNRLLIVGLILRVIVFLLASPFNADQHLEVIRFISEHGTLPVSNALQQSYHPPLYYLLMTPLALATSAAWPMHLASCVMSCINLVLIRRTMDDPLIVSIAPRASSRIAAFALVATLAQFVLFASYITNDTLTYLVGTLQFMAVLHYLRVRSPRRLAWLAGSVALGLLTKGTFLLTGFALAAVVLRIEWHRRGGLRAAVACAIFLAGSLVLGGYKYADNAIRLGRPLVHNQEILTDSPYPRTIWHGPATVYDINVLPLIRRPLIRPQQPPSYAQMMFATFWYAYINEPSFRGNFSGYERVGSITYAVAWVPTLVTLIGAVAAAFQSFRVLRRGVAVGADGEDDTPSLLTMASLAMLLANLVVIFAAGLKFDRWECFQGRLLFQSMLPMVVLFLVGLRVLPSRGLRLCVLAVCYATAGCALLYFMVEVALVRRLLPVDESALYEAHFNTPVQPR